MYKLFEIWLDRETHNFTVKLEIRDAKRRTMETYSLDQDETDEVFQFLAKFDRARLLERNKDV